MSKADAPNPRALKMYRFALAYGRGRRPPPELELNRFQDAARLAAYAALAERHVDELMTTSHTTIAAGGRYEPA